MSGFLKIGDFKPPPPAVERMFNGIPHHKRITYMVKHDKVKLAIMLAVQDHVFKMGQKYGMLPYTHHLEDVVEILIEFGYDDEDMQCSGWLHDWKEDVKDASMKLLMEMFGPRVVHNVEGVTNEEAPNRTQKWFLTAPKIKGDEERTAVKLADRIGHLRRGGQMVKMYKREHEAFVAGIYVPGLCEPMWAEYHDLISN